MTIFQQNIRHVPALESSNWLLIIDGAVTRPLTLTYDTLTNEFNTVSREITLACTGHQPNHPLHFTAIWHGIPLVELIAHCQPTHSAYAINFYCADGYATSLPADAIQNALLVTHMNEQPLPSDHGFPARLVVPDKAGYKMPKWIQHIVIADEAVTGFWESHGLSANGDSPAMVTIACNPSSCAPGETVSLHGIAYGISPTVAEIELSINGADSMKIALNQGSDGVAQQWATTWTPQFAGQHTISVQAGDATMTTTIKVRA